MKILKDTTDEQEILFLPRQDDFDKIVIENDSTNVSNEYTVTPQTQGYFAYISLVFDLEEGNFYNFKVYNGTDEVYYDRIFCTNQSESSYRITDGQFVNAPDTNNEFIIRN